MTGQVVFGLLAVAVFVLVQLLKPGRSLFDR
jgi:hypothetical protein